MSVTEFVEFLDPTVDIEAETAAAMAEAQAAADAAVETGDEEVAEVDPVKVGESVAEAYTIRIALVRATRLKAYDRARATQVAREWLLEAMGVEEDDDASALENMDMDAPEVQKFHALWTICRQAADIIGALVPDECVKWEQPARIVDWSEMDDELFSALLDKTWDLNPHWGQEFLSEGNV